MDEERHVAVGGATVASLIEVADDVTVRSLTKVVSENGSKDVAAALLEEQVNTKNMQSVASESTRVQAEKKMQPSTVQLITVQVEKKQPESSGNFGSSRGRHQSDGEGNKFRVKPRGFMWFTLGSLVAKSAAREVNRQVRWALVEPPNN